MALTNPNVIIDTTFSSKNIASAASVYTYTAAASGVVYINVKLTNAAGNGDYIIYLKKQWGGSGTASTMIPKTTAAAASGETVIEFPSIPVFVKINDVLDVYIDGLAGDTAVNGNIQIVALNFSTFEASADYALADLTKILGTTLTETSGYLAAGFKKFFNVGSPTGTLNSLPDAVPAANGGLPTVNSSSTLVQTVTLTTASKDAVVDGVWDEVLTAATHNVASSAGRRLRQLASNIIYDGTIVSSTENTVVLDSGASSTDGAYDPAMIVILSGAGIGQCRGIYQYEGSTRTAVLDRDFKTNPSGGDEYMILAWPGREEVNEGLIRAATTNTVQLNVNASAADDAYNGQIIFVRSGYGEDQVRVITDYVGSTRTATISKDWSVVPNTTSAYTILPTHVNLPEENATAVWANGTRTLTSFGTLIADIWAYSTRSLTTFGTLVADIWSYASRTLTSGGGSGGATPQEIWEYKSRTLTGWDVVIDLFWNRIPNWIKEKVSVITDDREIYRGVTNTLTYTNTTDINGATDIVFTVKNKYTDSNDAAILRISLVNGLTTLMGTPYAGGSQGGKIDIISQDNGTFNVIVEYDAANQLDPLKDRPYDIKAVKGSKVNLLKRGKITITPDISIIS